MVRLTVETIDSAYDYLNTCKQRELSLRSMQIPVIENLGVTRDRHDLIDFTENNIRKMENFPLLNRLESLYFHNNRIQQIQKNIGQHIPNLKWLVLTNNNLQELGDIDPLAGCKKLEYLTLLGNPLTHKQHYRAYVIYKIKSIRVLDYKRVKLAERTAADKLFKGKKGAALREKVGKKSDRLPEEDEAEKAAAIKQLPTEEQEKIKEAIKNAKSLQEVEALQQLLAAGRIPDNPSSNNKKQTENVDVEME